MTAVRVVLTYEDYVATPDDGMRYEIHDGELSVSPAPTFRHQQLLARLLVALRAHVSANDLGELVPAPVAVVLAATTVVEPDLVSLSKDRLGLVSARGTVDGAPTLVIEIASPSTARRDRQTKKQLYERYGVPYYWIVDPDARAIEVYRHDGGRYGGEDVRAGEFVDVPPFPGLRIDSAQFWA